MTIATSLSAKSLTASADYKSVRAFPRNNVFPFRRHSDAACLYFPMTTASKLTAAVAVSISMAAATQANAGEPLRVGYRHPPRPDLVAAIGGALAGAALELIPRAMAALAARLPSEAPAPPPPPVVVAQSNRSPPGGDVLDDIEGNTRGITRQEVEAALIDWCATHADAPLCVKLRVAPPPSPPVPGPRYAPAPPPYYRGYSAPVVRYYRPGRFRTWNGCQDGWTVQDGLCKPYRGY